MPLDTNCSYLELHVPMERALDHRDEPHAPLDKLAPQKVSHSSLDALYAPNPQRMGFFLSPIELASCYDAPPKGLDDSRSLKPPHFEQDAKAPAAPLSHARSVMPLRARDGCKTSHDLLEQRPSVQYDCAGTLRPREEDLGL